MIKDIILGITLERNTDGVIQVSSIQTLIIMFT